MFIYLLLFYHQIELDVVLHNNEHFVLAHFFRISKRKIFVSSRAVQNFDQNEKPVNEYKMRKKIRAYRQSKHSTILSRSLSVAIE